MTRPLKRVVKRLLTDQLAYFILSGRFVPGDKVKIDADTDGLTFTTESGVAVKRISIKIRRRMR